MHTHIQPHTYMHAHLLFTCNILLYNTLYGIEMVALKMKQQEKLQVCKNLERRVKGVNRADKTIMEKQRMYGRVKKGFKKKLLSHAERMGDEKLHRKWREKRR